MVAAAWKLDFLRPRLRTHERRAMPFAAEATAAELIRVVPRSTYSFLSLGLLPLLLRLLALAPRTAGSSDVSKKAVCCFPAKKNRAKQDERTLHRGERHHVSWYRQDTRGTSRATIIEDSLGTGRWPTQISRT